MAVMHVGVEEHQLEVVEEDVGCLQVRSISTFNVLQMFSVLNYY